VDLLSVHLERCVIQVTVSGEYAGSGFFVARSRVLTCAHVVSGASEVGIVWEGASLLARVLGRLPDQRRNPYPHPDLALLEVESLDHPCVRLDWQGPRLAPPDDRLRAVGWTQVLEKGVPGLTPITCEFEGVFRGGDGDRLQVKGGQVLRGMSGAPLLSERTGRVVGVLTTTRDHTDDLGGWATPTAAVIAGWAGLQEEHEAFHARDDAWRLAAAARLSAIVRPAWDQLPEQGDRAPSLLLRARYAVVPFQGRASEITELERWCADPAAPSFRLVVGAGGAGKTRLAVELCRRIHALGWLTGFLAEDADASAIDRVCERQEPTLLVLDYAEARSGKRLGALVQRFAEVGDGPPLRLLLLARAAGDWWQTELPNHLRDPELTLAGVLVSTLGPAAAGLDERVAHYRAAAAAFAGAQRMAARNDLAVPDLERAGFDAVLHIHMAALDAVGTVHDPQPGPSALGQQSALVAILQREGRYWRRSADARGLRHQDRVLRRAVAVSTLFGAEDESMAAAVLTRVPDLADAPAEQRRDLASWHRSLYPDQQWLAPLQPDLLAEELVTLVLIDTPELSRDGFKELTSAQAERALTLLDRAANRRPQDLQPILREILASDPESLGPSAITVAMQTGDPIGRLLAEVLEQSPTLPDSLAELAVSIPYPTTALRELAAVLSAHRVRRAMLAGEPAELASWLNNLSGRLADLGRREEARSAVKEAVNLYRRLAVAKPDVYLPYLAMSLSNLSIHVAKLEGREEALIAIQEAVDIRRRLAEDRPDSFLPDLATSLNNFSNSLADIGRLEESLRAVQEATDLHQRLAQVRPDRFLPDLATSLNNLSLRLADLGRREEALSAIEAAADLHRHLAEAKPDAFLPDLANSLNTRSLRLADLGRREEALSAIQEATDARRRLVQWRPDAFLPNLASSLNNLCLHLAHLGRREEALSAIQEATDLYRRLVREEPDPFLPYLANAHHNLANRLAEVGRHEEALSASQDATELYRLLAHDRPDPFLPYFAVSLNGLSNHLADLGRREDALSASRDAADLYRRLAYDRPDAFRHGLASSLTNLSNRHGDLGRPEEALGVIQEAVHLYRRLAQDWPDAFLPDLATSLNNLCIRLAELDRRTEALNAIDEAADIRRRLAHERPDAFLSDLAMSLNNVSICRANLGRREDSLSAIQEAVDLYRRLAYDRPDAFLPDLARALNNLSRGLADLRRQEDALDAIEESVDLYRRLAEARPDAFLRDLARSLYNLSLCLGDLGRREHALAAIEETVAIRRDLAVLYPKAHTDDLNLSIEVRRRLLQLPGEPDV
jgi:hypothetical protein